MPTSEELAEYRIQFTARGDRDVKRRIEELDRLGNREREVRYNFRGAERGFQRFSNRANRSLGRVRRDSRLTQSAIFNITQGLEDAVVGAQLGGLSGATRGVANNVAQLGASFGRAGTAIAGVGSIALLVLPPLISHLRDSAREAEETEQAVKGVADEMARLAAQRDIQLKVEIEAAGLGRQLERAFDEQTANALVRQAEERVTRLFDLQAARQGLVDDLQRRLRQAEGALAAERRVGAAVDNDPAIARVQEAVRQLRELLQRAEATIELEAPLIPAAQRAGERARARAREVEGQQRRVFEQQVEAAEAEARLLRNRNRSLQEAQQDVEVDRLIRDGRDPAQARRLVDAQAAARAEIDARNEALRAEEERQRTLQQREADQQRAADRIAETLLTPAERLRESLAELRLLGEKNLLNDEQLRRAEALAAERAQSQIDAEQGARVGSQSVQLDQLASLIQRSALDRETKKQSQLLEAVLKENEQEKVATQKVAKGIDQVVKLLPAAFVAQ